MDWFYHDPGQGRVGPLSADELRERYRGRRIQLDTLVWREGMREWQPLDRMGEELDLLSVTPDNRAPPPLPPGGASPATFHAAPAMAVGGRGPYGPIPRAAAPPKRMSGCLIALIVCAALAVPVIAILAAVAAPAYNDYVIRSKVLAQVDARAPAIEAAFAQWAPDNPGRCPASVSELALADHADGIDFGNAGGRCAFQVTVHGIRPEVEGRTVLFVAPDSPGSAWDCTGGNLPARYRTSKCRPEGGPTP